jgi:predicted Abi (CAAX) family protease
MKHRSLSWFRRLNYRLYAGLVTRPQRKDLGFAIGCLILYSGIYLPFGLSLGFLHWQPEPNPWQWFNVMLAALVMPGLNEELIFRVLLIPHPTEPIGPISRQRLIFLSWILFLLAHLAPWSPAFFHQLPFLIGAGLLSRSIWMPLLIHWTIVVNWLLLWGGLEKFSP